MNKLSTINIDDLTRPVLMCLVQAMSQSRTGAPPVENCSYFFQSVSAFFFPGDPAELSTDLINLVKICACGNNKQTNKFRLEQI